MRDTEVHFCSAGEHEAPLREHAPTPPLSIRSGRTARTPSTTTPYPRLWRCGPHWNQAANVLAGWGARTNG